MKELKSIDCVLGEGQLYSLYFLGLAHHFPLFRLPIPIPQTSLPLCLCPGVLESVLPFPPPTQRAGLWLEALGLPGGPVLQHQSLEASVG